MMYALALLCLLITQPNSIQEYDDALERSRDESKPILILFTSDQCERNLETNDIIESSDEVRELLDGAYVFVKLIVNQQTVGLYGQFEIDKFGMNVQPYYVITDHTERIIDTSKFIPTEKELLKFLYGGLVLY